jgi:hypothetical protein
MPGHYSFSFPCEGLEDLAAPASASAKSAHQIHDEADQQDEPEAATADRGTAEIKSTTADQQEDHDDN